MLVQHQFKLLPTITSIVLFLDIIIIAPATLNGSPTIANTSDGGTMRESRVKVLFVKNNDKQHAIEEAASLSLDLPSNDEQLREGMLANEAETESSDDSQQASSLGYRRTSLASLTLHQRDPRWAQNESENGNGSDAKQQQAQATNSEGGSTLRNNKHSVAPSIAEPWTELYLPRLKPSWLNVSSRFKITGKSIEEIEYVMPAEYLLRAAFDSPILLKTKLGIIEGVRSIKFNKHLYTFLSVPYAKPPVDEFRFKAPQPVEKWEGILQTTKWPPFCVQPSMTLASKSSPVHVLSQIMTEDCLYMNIWTPSLKFNRNRKRPVMVWLHGGAFQYGGISVDENDASALALLGDVVVVTLNYRVSAFGFLNANNPINAPNNVGLLDQRMAMEWVQANIKQFGGDPQQVTLFGESAGGHSVGMHMASPGSQHLFKRAILQSGVPTSMLRSYDINTDNKGPATGEGISSIMMAKRLNCFADRPTTTTTMTTEAPMTTTETIDKLNSTKEGDVSETTEAENEDGAEFETLDAPRLNDETLECMRRKSSLEILKAMGAPGNAGFFPTGDDPKGVFPNGPIMGSFDPDNLKVGPQKDYLIGTNMDEGTFMLHYGMPSVFPSRGVPKVDSIEALKKAIQYEIDKLAIASAISLNKSEINSASGNRNGGAQAHLYKPLLRMSTTVLESFMPKSRVTVLENGTVVGNTSLYIKEAEFGKNVASLITDIIFLCPSRSLARTLAESGRNVYFYLYDHRSSISQYHPWLGVTHHDEVEFVFGRPLRLADVYSGKDIEISQRVIKSWAHFAYTGQMPDQLNVRWPKYGVEENNYMVLESDKASIGQRYHDRFCNIYDTVIAVHLQDG